jgi:hypothetical protein
MYGGEEENQEKRNNKDSKPQGVGSKYGFQKNLKPKISITVQAFASKPIIYIHIWLYLFPYRKTYYPIGSQFP